MNNGNDVRSCLWVKTMYKTNTKQREWERYTSSCRSSSLNKGEGNHERLWGDRWSCFIILHQRKQTLFLLFYHCKVLKRTQLRSTQNHPNNTANITQNRQYHLHSSSSSAQFNYTHSLSTSVEREREREQTSKNAMQMQTQTQTQAFILGEIKNEKKA